MISLFSLALLKLLFSNTKHQSQIVEMENQYLDWPHQNENDASYPLPHRLNIEPFLIRIVIPASEFDLNKSLNNLSYSS